MIEKENGKEKTNVKKTRQRKTELYRRMPGLRQLDATLPTLMLIKSDQTATEEAIQTHQLW